MKPTLSIVCLVFMISVPAIGQEIADSSDGAMDEVYETALENGTQDLDDSPFAESLFEASSEGIDVNSASASDFLKIPGLDPTIVARIIAYRADQRFQRLEELLLVKGMSGQLFRQIRGFFRIRTDSAGGKSETNGRVHLTTRTSRDLNPRRGYQDGTYVGSPLKIYNRLNGRWSVGSGILVEAAGLAEKDAGERKVGDFSTGYLSVGTTSGSFQCVVGNYVVEAGQGLVFWKSSGATKGSEVIATVTKNPRGLEPNCSSDENAFLNGAAVQDKIGNLDVTVLYSQKKMNATLNRDGCITNVDATGLFRTSGELEKRASSSERLLGFDLNARIDQRLRMGIRYYSSRFANPIVVARGGSIPTRAVSVVGSDFSYASTTIGSFAEIAVDRTRSVAMVGGIIFEPVVGLTAALVGRSYPTSFLSVHGFGFGESGNQIQNERGVYASLRTTPLPWLIVSTYCDQFIFPAGGYGSSLPVSGNESMVCTQIRVNDEIALQLQIRLRTHGDKQLELDEFLRSMAVVERTSQVNYRATFEWCPRPSVRWRSRFEHVRVATPVTPGNSGGYLLFQDFRFKPSAKFSIDARAIVFETASFASRIYEYESELRGTFVNPGLYGKGIRMYLMTTYGTGGVQFSAKYSTTVKPGLRMMGTGPAEITGDTDNRVSAQIEVTY